MEAASFAFAQSRASPMGRGWTTADRSVAGTFCFDSVNRGIQLSGGPRHPLRPPPREPALEPRGTHERSLEMRATALALALLAAVPSVATAGIDLSWNQCVTAAPADTVTWSCAPGTVSNLFANFQIPDGLAGFVALDGVIDVEDGSPTVPPFSKFQNGGCNALGLEILADRPDAV